MRATALALILGSILAVVGPAAAAGAGGDGTTRGASDALRAAPAAVPPAPTHRRHKVLKVSCPTTTCRYTYRITWDPVASATRGYRIFVENYWQKSVSGPDCVHTGLSARRLLASVPAGRTSWDGVFTPEYRPSGLFILGSRYTIAAVNASGRSPLRIVRPTSYNNGNVVVYADGIDCP